MCYSLVRSKAAALLSRLKGMQTDILNIRFKSQILHRQDFQTKKETKSRSSSVLSSNSPFLSMMLKAK